MSKKADVRQVVSNLIEACRAGDIEPLVPVPKVPKEPQKSRRTECEHLLLFSDLQAGLKTPSFGKEVIKRRVQTLANGVREILHAQRKARPINKLNIAFLGDMVHGEKIGINVNWAELEDSVKAQAFHRAAPACYDLIRAMLAEYPEIEAVGVPGNHGILGRDAHYDTNWDLITYEVAAAKLEEQSNVKFTVSEDFCAKQTIFDTRFFFWHGHQVMMRGIVPIYGIQRDVAKWAQSEGPFDVSCLGHFHTFHNWEHNGIEVFVNGTFLTDDRWTREYIKTTPSMIQVLLTIHPKRGVIDCKKVALEAV